MSRRGLRPQRETVRTARSSERLVWLDGRILPASRAKLSIDERGFLYGDAVFETALVSRGAVVQWRPHERRLRASLRRFAIAWPRVDLERAAARLLATARLAEGALRVTVSRGVGEGLLPARSLAATVLLTLRALPPDLEQRRRDGISAIRLPFGRGRGSAVGAHKTTAYLGAILGRIEAQRAGADDALYVEGDGTVGEATASNLFAVVRGTLQTPPLDGDCLPGVTRATVLRIARRARIAAREAPLRATDLIRCSEIFLCSSVQGIVPIVRLDARKIGDGRPGPVTRSLQARHAAFVARAAAAAARRRSPVAPARDPC